MAARVSPRARYCGKIPGGPSPWLIGSCEQPRPFTPRKHVKCTLIYNKAGRTPRTGKNGKLVYNAVARSTPELEKPESVDQKWPLPILPMNHPVATFSSAYGFT